MFRLPDEHFVAKQDWKTWSWYFLPECISYQELGPIQDRSKLPQRTTGYGSWGRNCRREGHNRWVPAFRTAEEIMQCTVWKPNPLQTLKHPTSCARAYLRWCTWEMSWLVFVITKLGVMEVGHLPVQQLASSTLILYLWNWHVRENFCSASCGPKTPHWVQLWLVSSSKVNGRF